MIDYVSEKVKMLEPMSESQHQNIADKVDLFSKLENVMQALQSRTETFRSQIQRDIDDRMKLAQEYERDKRAQMVESRTVADSIPSGYFSSDLQKQIEEQSQKVQDTASAGSFLKSLFTWLILAVILVFTYMLWKNMDETEKKFKL